MAEISIPGVSNKYKTNDYIEALMAKERIPLTREQDALERYKEEQNAWRTVNQKMNALRDSAKRLYSFENPFDSKIAESSEERAITATAKRNAEVEDFKVDVIQTATADRFLSEELPRDFLVPEGKYVFEVNKKEFSFNWRGGKLKDFAESLNKRANGFVKASIIGVNSEKNALLLESTKTGKENLLVFRDAALNLALNTGILEEKKLNSEDFALLESNFRKIQSEENLESENPLLPKISSEKIELQKSQENQKITLVLPPRNGCEIEIPQKITLDENKRVEFWFSQVKTQDISEELNNFYSRPTLSSVGSVEFEGAIVQNFPSDTAMQEFNPVPHFDALEVETEFFVKSENGNLSKLETQKIEANEKGAKKIVFSISDFENPVAIVAKNRSTGKVAQIFGFSAFDSNDELGYAPKNPASVANDAIIKYEGITIKRATNEIDDVVPNVTLNLYEKTEKPATISILSDSQAAKDALITFVGNYNQLVAEMNVLGENKAEIIAELDYFTEDEKIAAEKRLGMFQGDFSLSTVKAALQNIVSANYNWDENAKFTMLSQLGISTNATGDRNYSASRLRGYLEIDEKKLDSVLEGKISDLKKIFGYDSDGDLVVDSGIAYAIEKQTSSWTQNGGIISGKNGNINSKISSSESKIKRLEQQLAQKESQLKQKYGKMENTLNNLQSQSDTISNFSRSNNSNR